MKIHSILKGISIVLLPTMLYSNSLNVLTSKDIADGKSYNDEQIVVSKNSSIPQKENKSNLYENLDQDVKDAIKIDSFVEKDIFVGHDNLSFPEEENDTTINFIDGNITKEDIITVKKKKEELNKITNSPIENVQLKSETIYYVPEKGLEATIFLKIGYSTEVEFIDDLGNPIPVVGNSIGSKIFDAKIPQPNIISMIPTSKYKDTNFNVRLEGVADPIILRIKEGANNISHTRVKIIVTGKRGNEEKNEQNLKTNILSELLKYGTLHGDTQLDYEVVDIARKETSYFEKKYLKVFKVNKYGKEFTIILLDNMYEILGQNGNNFNRYQNSFNVYFLPDNREVFTIMTKLNNKKKPTSLDFEKDSGLIEKYRIIIKD